MLLACYTAQTSHRLPASKYKYRRMAKIIKRRLQNGLSGQFLFAQKIGNYTMDRKGIIELHTLVEVLHTEPRETRCAIPPRACVILLFLSYPWCNYIIFFFAFTQIYITEIYFLIIYFDFTEIFFFTEKIGGLLTRFLDYIN